MRIRNLLITCLLTLIASNVFSYTYVIVEKTANATVQTAVENYTDALREYEGRLFVINSTNFDATSTPEMLRAHLQSLAATSYLEGVVLVGNLPIPMYELPVYDASGAVIGGSSCPSDLFYMDLDGTWIDTAGPAHWANQGNWGTYDGHSGSIEADIWVSRISNPAANGLLGSMDVVINDYFNRAINRMRGVDNVREEALAFLNNSTTADPSDPGWPTAGTEILLDQLGYTPDEITIVGRPNDTKAAWIDSLRQGFEYATFWEHSGSGGNHFFNSDFTNADYAAMTDMGGAPSNVRFYNLFACSNGRYDVADYMAAMYAYGHNGLVAVASARSGAMNAMDSYNLTLGGGSSFGTSFKRWFNDHVLSTNPVPHGEAEWHYGMTLCGAGTLRLERYGNRTTYGPLTVSSDVKNFAVYGEENAYINDRAQVKKTYGTFWGNVGCGGPDWALPYTYASIGVDAHIGDLYCRGTALLRHCNLHGDAVIRSPQIQIGTQYDPARLETRHDFDAFRLYSYDEDYLEHTFDNTWDVWATDPNQDVHLNPGTVYGNLTVRNGGKVIFDQPGTYYIRNINLDGPGTLDLSQVTFGMGQNITIITNGYRQTAGSVTGHPQRIMVISCGESSAYFGNNSIAWSGTIICPVGSVNIDSRNNCTLNGAFIGKGVTIHQDVVVTHYPHFDF